MTFPQVMPLTGERTVPGIWHENYWFARHEAAYRWLTGLGLPSGRRVLEAGCGEGYGAGLLAAAGAAAVLGLDYDTAAIRHVHKRYAIPCVQGNLVQTGFADDSFDLVVSLQTIEHLWEQPRFVTECRRVLRPDGTLVVSTPNRLTFPSGNWYHTRELTGPELVELTRAEFGNVETFGLWHGPRLTAWDEANGSCVDAQLAADADEWSIELQALVRSVRHTDFTIRASRDTADLDGSLDLIVLARA
ncbi:class I SAM-dependent methyltransferase [Kribbella deserti]|uniref:Methyltransferase domain-containing protein n=1 Tax=Kribbella deserti TaxID=1926257 RepID=A0ABV6QVA0_9ACTN